jgi:hypothetical protein
MEAERCGENLGAGHPSYLAVAFPWLILLRPSFCLIPLRPKDALLYICKYSACRLYNCRA